MTLDVAIHVAVLVPPTGMVPNVAGFAPDTIETPGGRLRVTLDAATTKPPVLLTRASTRKGVPESTSAGTFSST